MNDIRITENGINLVIEVNEKKDLRLLHFSSLPFGESSVKEDEKSFFRLLELQLTGRDHDDHHGSKNTGSVPGKCLEFNELKDYRNQLGRKLEFFLSDNGINAIAHIQFFDDIAVIRSWSEVKNIGKTAVGLEYLSSFALTGIGKEGCCDWHEKSDLSIPHNTWNGEAQWKRYDLPELGLTKVFDFSMKRINITNTGTWSTSEYLPMGFYRNRETGNSLLWQIEHNGSWHWEISDIAHHLYLQLSGPTEESSWWKEIVPGDTFVSVPAAVVMTNGDFENAICEMTKYRRRIRRENEDNRKLPVLFNDYFNCLFGDATTEKLKNLADAAAEAGCEYFLIDCGWYADGDMDLPLPWWNGVGEWIASKNRFPNGIKEPMDYIRSKGMVPGLWLEIEVMGIDTAIAKKVPKDWFFTRHGAPVVDHGRYQLDFRNPRVIEYADNVIKRVVEEYGAGYIKIDYNIEAGPGTEIGSSSFGDGLLDHNRAYLEWLDRIICKYPDLVIENCGSGGMRMDYAFLSRLSVQSCSDQTDYRKMAVIAAACTTAAAPEQCAIWSYPLETGDNEEVVFNMVNTMLLRIHQSGYLSKMPRDRFDLIKEGISCYKSIRKNINSSFPFWPIGLPSFSDGWVSFGLSCGDCIYLAVWRLNSKAEECVLPISRLNGTGVSVKCIYPEKSEINYEWDNERSALNVNYPSEYMARLFCITPSQDAAK